MLVPSCGRTRKAPSESEAGRRTGERKHPPPGDRTGRSGRSNRDGAPRRRASRARAGSKQVRVIRMLERPESVTHPGHHGGDWLAAALGPRILFRRRTQEAWTQTRFGQGRRSESLPDRAIFPPCGGGGGPYSGARHPSICCGTCCSAFWPIGFRPNALVTSTSRPCASWADWSRNR
jgi:hypothetical protein